MSIDISALGQVTDTSWGRSTTSTPMNGSVKVRIVGNRLVVTFGVLTNTNARYGIPHTKQACHPEAVARINTELERIKGEYKDITGDALKLRQVDCSESVEVVNSSPNSPVKTVIYRMSALVEID